MKIIFEIFLATYSNLNSGIESIHRATRTIEEKEGVSNYKFAIFGYSFSNRSQDSKQIKYI